MAPQTHPDDDSAEKALRGKHSELFLSRLCLPPTLPAVERNDSPQGTSSALVFHILWQPNNASRGAPPSKGPGLRISREQIPR